MASSSNSLEKWIFLFVIVWNCLGKHWMGPVVFRVWACWVLLPFRCQWGFLNVPRQWPYAAPNYTKSCQLLHLTARHRREQGQHCYCSVLPIWWLKILKAEEGKKKKNWPQTVLLILVAGFDCKRSSDWETRIMRNTALCAERDGICQSKRSLKPDGAADGVTWKPEQTQESSQASRKKKKNLGEKSFNKKHVRLNHTFQKRCEDVACRGWRSRRSVHETLKSTTKRPVCIGIVALGHWCLLGFPDTEI